MNGNKGMATAVNLMNNLSVVELLSGAYLYPNEDALQFINTYTIGLKFERCRVSDEIKFKN